MTAPQLPETAVGCCGKSDAVRLHDAMPEHLRAAILVGAFSGLRIAEACGLRVADVDFMRGIISPTVQFPAEPLKSQTSQTPVPIAHTVALELANHVRRWPAETVLVNELGRQLPRGY